VCGAEVVPVAAAGQEPEEIDWAARQGGVVHGVAPAPSVAAGGLRIDGGGGGGSGRGRHRRWLAAGGLAHRLNTQYIARCESEDNMMNFIRTENSRDNTIACSNFSFESRLFWRRQAETPDLASPPTILLYLIVNSISSLGGARAEAPTGAADQGDWRAGMLISGFIRPTNEVGTFCRGINYRAYSGRTNDPRERFDGEDTLWCSGSDSERRVQCSCIAPLRPRQTGVIYAVCVDHAGGVRRAPHPCNSEPGYPWGVPKGAPGPGWPPGAGRLAADRPTLSRCGLICSVIAPAFFIGPGWLPEQQVRLTR
jgi:hypothetical protein